MSWYIEYLLRRSDEIHNAVSSPEKSIADTDHDSYESAFNLDSDSYNDLLLIEKKIAELVNLGIIKNKDVEFLSLIGAGFSFREVGKRLGVVNKTAVFRFRALCALISYYTGYIFCDDEFLRRLQEDHNLTDEQVEIARQYMQSTLKDKVVRR